MTFDNILNIVVLIILAGVAISLTLGENGAFRKATIAKKEYSNSEAKETEELDNVSNSIDGYVGYTRGQTSEVTIDGNEHVIGTFYGKPLYEKSFTGTTPNSTGGNIQDVSSLNIDKTVNVYGFVDEGTCTVPIGYGNIPQNDYFCIYYDKTTTSLCARNLKAYGDKPYLLILQYTKTTD